MAQHSPKLNLKFVRHYEGEISGNSGPGSDTMLQYIPRLVNLNIGDVFLGLSLAPCRSTVGTGPSIKLSKK